MQGADVLFLSREGIRSLNRSQTDAQGGAGLPLSTSIQSQIDRINWATADRAVATYWDNTAYFAVPVDGSIYNNFIIAYNTQRPGWRFLDWTPNGWARAKVGSNRKLFFLGAVNASDGQSTYTNGHHLYEAFNGYIDPVQKAVDSDEHTRGFTFIEEPSQRLMHTKIWRQLQLKIQSASTCATISVQYKVDDDNEWIALRHISVDPSDAYPFLPVYLPFSLDSGRILKRSLSLHSIRPGYKLQLRFRDQDSFGPAKILEAELFAHRQAVNFFGY
jgi:hypothetical protein